MDQDVFQAIMQKNTDLSISIEAYMWDRHEGRSTSDSERQIARAIRDMHTILCEPIPPRSHIVVDRDGDGKR
jgi:hypothetical protein